MANFRMLSFDDGGKKTDLLSLEDCQEAFDEGRLTATTAVVIYYSDGSMVREIAGECRELSSLFAQRAQSPTPGEPAADNDAATASEAEAEGFPEASHLGDEDASLQAKTDSSAVDAQPSTQRSGPADIDAVAEAHDSQNPATAGSPFGGKAPVELLYVFFGVVALLALGLMVSRCSNNGGGNSGEPPAVIAADTASVAQTDDPSTWQTMYGVSPLNVRAAASGDSPLVTNLPRGIELTGLIVAGENDDTTNWLLIKRGPYTGRYVSAVNLSVTAPPEIDGSSAGDYFVIADVTPLASPDSSSAVIADPRQRLSAGQKVKTNGTIRDWAEVGLNQGGVGYVPTSDLSETEPAMMVDAANGASQGAWLNVANRCGSRLEIGILYHYDGQWRDNGGAIWTWYPYMTSFPSQGGSADSNRILADTNEIYIVIYKRDGTSYDNGYGGDSHINYDGRSVAATKYFASTNPDGSYQVTIC